VKLSIFTGGKSFLYLVFGVVIYSVIIVGVILSAANLIGAYL
jgi:hypothetical protein